MKAFTTILILFIAATLSSCSTHGLKKSRISDLKFSDANYQKRPTLQESFFSNGKSGFSEAQIRTLLNSKVDLKKDLKVAVVRLCNCQFNQHYRNNSPLGKNGMVVTEKNSKALRSIIKKSRYIKDISMIPSFLMPTNKSLKNLRDSAALFQADLLLMIYTRSNTDYEFNITSKNEAKAKASIEAIVVDVRTGVIPFSSIVTGTEHGKKDDKQDFSNQEFRERITIAAEDNAIEQLSNEIGIYFN